MPAAVPRQKGHRHAADVSHEKRVAGSAEGRLQNDFASVLEEVVEARTPDNAHVRGRTAVRLCHSRVLHNSDNRVLKL